MLQRRQRSAHVLVLERDHEIKISGEPGRAMKHDGDATNHDVADVRGL
jgi:hypothetical protein